MNRRIFRGLACLAAAGVPLVLLANSGATLTPVLKRTGADVDGGLNCTACHGTFAPANSDPRGKVTIQAGNYTPGRPQNIRVTVEHPEALRWGFQMTARYVSDETKQAGSFTPSERVALRCDDGQLRGAMPPCAEGQLQFVSHTAISTNPNSRNSATWEVEWTPPAQEMGRVVFYAAGNAANNNSNFQGDYIYTTKLEISAEGACPVSRMPTLRSVNNAASYQPGIGMNAILSLFGVGFYTENAKRTAGRGDFVEGRFPKELACVAVEVAGERVPITYVQNDQINAQAPTKAINGPVEVRVILNPGRPNELRTVVATVNMNEYMPALFTFNGKSVAAVFPNSTTLVADPAVVPGGRPAAPGEVITVYGTGFGATSPTWQAGEVTTGLSPIRDPYTVTIGSLTLAREDILYGGLAPGAISGLYQFNLRIPASADNGDNPVAIRIGGVSTPAGLTIPVKRP